MGLSDLEKRIVLAVGQTMFPRDAVLSIDADDAQIVAWADDYVSRMPFLTAGQLRAMLQAVEYGYPLWSGRPGDRFTTARPQERAEFLESWERSSTYSQRMLYEALRAMFTFGYVDSDPVHDAIAGHSPGGPRGYWKREPTPTGPDDSEREGAPLAKENGG
jgi:hypothetical protein